MEYLLLKYAHLIAFVYWLGGDLGTYIAGNYVIRRDISEEARGVAFKIMMACDQGPKITMPLIFPLGLQMANMTSLLSLPGWFMVVVWLLCLIWCGNVLYLHFSGNESVKATVAKYDFIFRMVVTLAILLYAIAGLLDPELIRADWVAWKMIVFAALVGCGVMVRIYFKPFVPAYVAMMRNGATPETDEALASSLHRARIFVWVIWFGLFLNAAIGLHLL